MEVLLGNQMYWSASALRGVLLGENILIYCNAVFREEMGAWNENGCARVICHSHITPPPPPHFSLLQASKAKRYKEGLIISVVLWVISYWSCLFLCSCVCVYFLSWQLRFWSICPMVTRNVFLLSITIYSAHVNKLTCIRSPPKRTCSVWQEGKA